MPFIRDPFAALVSSIVHQQLSMKAAGTILSRLRAICTEGRLTPKALSALPADRLRSAGLSRQKIRYLRDLSERFGSGRIRAAGLRRMDDERVIATVTQILGIGRWTAEMLLIFGLGRPDVWPIDDLGIRSAAKKAYRLRGDPSAARLARLAEPWRPYRSVASWYLWRSLGSDVLPGFTAS
jgi:DNA-3-methyladenine glycosylase II